MTSDNRTLPKQGLPAAEVIKQIEAFRTLDPAFERGRMTAYCMMGTRELQDVVHEAYGVYFFQNAIVRRFMPGLLRMEDEIKSMAAGILSGGTPGVRVNLTSGGSESLFCGLHAAREWAKEHHPSITQPEVIAPFSAHATISKACHYLGLKLTRIAVGKDYRADVRAMEAAIGPNTIALLGSAPSWPYGKVDSIEELSAIGQRRNLWVHVDACVGGYLSPFVSKLGYKIPAWDFRLPGVTSISADLHKYAYAPKPASTIAYRSEEHQKYHHVYPSDWPSSTYMSEGMIGSRPAGAVAATWAVFHYLGEQGYVDYARRTMETKQKLIDGLKKLGMKPWDTDLCVLLFETAELPPASVVGALSEAGWACMGTQQPPLVQLIIDPLSGEVVDDYLRDLGKVLQKLRGGAEVKEGTLGYAD
jgi:sphinganine-1-phosphate aldolase